MNPIQINLPPDAQASNYLYPVLTDDDLTQDMLTVRLSNGYFIDVGWYPEHDPNGRFMIRVFQGEWNNQKLNQPIETREIAGAIYAVERLAEHYSRPQIPTSRAGEVRTNMILPSV